MRRPGFGLRLAALAAAAAWAAGASGAWAAGPKIALSPTENHPGSNTQVNGNSFGANEAIDIYFDTTDEALAFTNSNGAFGKTPVPVPANALPGTHYITAVQRSNGEGAQQVFTVNTDWPQFHFNEKHKGLNAWENVLTPNNVSSLDVAWTAALASGGTNSSPAVVDGVVYEAAVSNSLYALNASSGALLWTATTGGPIVLSSPAVANGVAYVGCDDQKLYAFNASTGAPLWSATTGSYILSSPVVANGVVYVGSEDDNLYAFDAASGAPLWTATTGAGIAGSPAVANGMVYAGSGDGNLYAYALNGGNDAVYRGKRKPPAISSLHPDWNLKPARN